MRKILSWDVGIKHLAFCIINELDTTDQKFNIELWDNIDLINDTKCKDLDPQYICRLLYKKLNEYTIFLTVNEIYIENQPSLKNPIMKSISVMVFSYFNYLSLMNNLNIKIKYASPVQKIKIDENLIFIINDYSNEHTKLKGENKCKCKTCKINIELIENKEKYKDSYSKYK